MFLFQRLDGGFILQANKNSQTLLCIPHISKEYRRKDPYVNRSVVPKNRTGMPICRFRKTEKNEINNE